MKIKEGLNLIGIPKKLYSYGKVSSDCRSNPILGLGRGCWCKKHEYKKPQHPSQQPAGHSGLRITGVTQEFSCILSDIWAD